MIKVRTPRKQHEPSNEPQKVRGSTRLEAKKQRRRDGRDAGRRRSVITESEFLARRESVDRAMVVRSKADRIQIAVLEDGVLVEHYVAKAAEASLIGNVYLGRVQNVLPSMEAAFVDIGRGRNAVLYSGEVDWEAAAADHKGGSQARRIELALKPGDKVLVQVSKDPVGHKGARLTSQVSLPGRYLVYVPNGSMNGISRKLPDTERARLKKILKEVLPENVGVIVRTAAEGATEEQLTLDVNRLTAQWAEISHALESVQAPALLHSEPDLLVKIVRDVFNEDFHRLVIEGEDAEATILKYLGQVAPDLIDRVERYAGTADSFDEFRISEQIEKALDRKVWLPSGGSLVIDRTEAMTVDRREHRQVRRFRRQSRRDRDEEQPRGGGRDRAPTAAARHRRHHRRRLHRHGARIQPRPRAAATGRVPQPRPYQAPGGRGHLARSDPDDAEEVGTRPRRVVQRAVRVLRRPRHHHPPRPGDQAPPNRPAGNPARARWQGRRLRPQRLEQRRRVKERYRCGDPCDHGGREERVGANRGQHDCAGRRGGVHRGSARRGGG